MSGVRAWACAARPRARPSKTTCPGRAPQAHDGAQRRRLAGAVAAEQHRHLARRHDEVDAVQDVVRADVRVHAAQREHAVMLRPLFPGGEVGIGVDPSGSRSRAKPRYASCTIGEAITASGSPSATSWPLCSTMMRSASSRTTSILCSTSRMVLSVLLQRADQVEDHRHVVAAHAGGRLVEHVDGRLERHQHRHLELALVAVRQAAGGVVGAGRPAAPARSARRRAPASRAGRSTPTTGRGPRGAATAPPGARSRAP